MADGDTFDETGQGEAQDGNHDIRQLREKAKRTDELEARVAQMERERAIEKAGIDVESGPGQLFLRVYDGEADPEAIKSEAAKFGVPLRGQAQAGETGQAEATPTTDAPSEPSGTAERQALANNARSDEVPEADPRQASLAAAEEARKQGATFEDEAASFLGVRATAAQNGDPRVVLPPTGARPRG